MSLRIQCLARSSQPCQRVEACQALAYRTVEFLERMIFYNLATTGIELRDRSVGNPVAREPKGL